jgi:hypothetical protein
MLTEEQRTEIQQEIDSRIVALLLVPLERRSLYGGRWNHKGTPVIYSAASRALCALEVLANADELADDHNQHFD